MTGFSYSFIYCEGAEILPPSEIQVYRASRPQKPQSRFEAEFRKSDSATSPDQSAL